MRDRRPECSCPFPPREGKAARRGTAERGGARTAGTKRAGERARAFAAGRGRGAARRDPKTAARTGGELPPSRLLSLRHPPPPHPPPPYPARLHGHLRSTPAAPAALRVASAARGVSTKAGGGAGALLGCPSPRRRRWEDPAVGGGRSVLWPTAWPAGCQGAAATAPRRARSPFSCGPAVCRRAATRGFPTPALQRYPAGRRADGRASRRQPLCACGRSGDGWLPYETSR